MKKIKSLTAILLVALFIFSAVSCGTTADPWDEAIYTEDTTLGEGKTKFTLEVCVGENKVVFSLSTNEQMLDKALLALELIEGKDDKYGLYIERVNGILADYNVDQTYWALYINGDYAMTGISSTEVVNGATYKLSREK